MKLSDRQYQELHDYIYNYPTLRENGFLPDELRNVLRKYSNLYERFNVKKYDEAMMGNTCGIYEGKFVIYHCDVLHAIHAGIENRDLTLEEWD